MRAGKIIAIAGLALAAFVAIALVVVSQLDFSRYKPLIAEQAKAATGRDLRIDGAIRLAPSLVPALAVEDVRFQNASFGTRPDMVLAKRMEISVALLPLLRGQIDIRHVELIGPDILLETDKSGRGNWEFSEAPATPARPQGASAPASLPSLGALLIQDGLLTYRDGISGKSTTIAVKSFTAKGEPLALDLAGAYDGAPSALRGDLHLGDKTARLADLAASFGGSDLAGSLAFDWSGRPRLTADITSNRIDLADFAGKDSAPPKKDANQDGGRLFSADPLDLSGLRAVDAKLAIKIASLRQGKLEAQSVAASATLQNGRLAIEQLAGRFADGELSGQGHVAALAGPGAETALTFKADKIDLAALARALDAGDMLVGRGDLALDVKGQGASVRALMASLGGKASWIMGKGRVKNGYVDLLGTDLLRFAASAGTGGADATAVNCFVARFDVAKGVAASQGILFDTDRMTVKGEGNVNLGTERLALLFTPRPKETSLVNLALPWHVEGTLAKPSVNVDQGAAAERGAMALLNVINPLTLLVPLVTGGETDQNPCLTALNAPAKPPARAPGGGSSGGVRGFLDSIIPGR